MLKDPINTKWQVKFVHMPRLGDIYYLARAPLSICMLPVLPASSSVAQLLADECQADWTSQPHEPIYWICITDNIVIIHCCVQLQLPSPFHPSKFVTHGTHPMPIWKQISIAIYWHIESVWGDFVYFSLLSTVFSTHLSFISLIRIYDPMIN